MKKSILKTVGYIFLLILAYVALQACFTFIAMIAATAYAVYKGYIPIDSIKEIENYTILTSTSTTNHIYVWAMSAALFLSALSMLSLLHFTKGYRLRANIFRSIEPKPLAYSTMLIFSSMLALNIFVQWFGLEDKTEMLLEDLSLNPIGIITISLLAPLLEEVMFRGAIQGHIMRNYNPWCGIICAALAFGIFHFNPIQSVYATLIGFIFGWIYYRTGSLLSVIVGHVLNNSMAAITILFFSKEDILPIPNGITSATTEMASEILFFIFFAILSVYFAMKLHRSQPPVPSPWHDATNAV